MPFIELQTIDSTNNYAFSRIHAGLAEHGMAIFAHEQTAGKGQRGKRWVSSKESNLALSIIINPGKLVISQQFQLSTCAAVSVYELFQNYVGQGVKIKWPNDLYWEDRKAGGILIESIVGSRESGVHGHEVGAGAWNWAVVGIGININQTLFPSELTNPVSLKQITGKNFDPVELAKELCRIFNHRFEQLTHEGFNGLYKEYVSHLYKLNEKVRLKKDNRVFEAVIKGVSSSGKLVAHHGIEDEFDFGTIEWVI